MCLKYTPLEYWESPVVGDERTRAMAVGHCVASMLFRPIFMSSRKGTCLCICDFSDYKGIHRALA